MMRKNKYNLTTELLQQILLRSMITYDDYQVIEGVTTSAPNSTQWHQKGRKRNRNMHC